MPGGKPRPPSMPPIFCLASSSTFFTASLQAATTRSCSISTSPATSGSIFTLSRFFWPSIFTDTIPPPAEASTRICASSCCRRSCICCACFIMVCMFPGSFMSGLLVQFRTALLIYLFQVADRAHFAAKNFAKALHLRIRQCALGHFVLLACRLTLCRRQPAFSPSVVGERHLNFELPLRNFLNGA